MTSLRGNPGKPVPDDPDPLTSPLDQALRTILANTQRHMLTLLDAAMCGPQPGEAVVLLESLRAELLSVEEEVAVALEAIEGALPQARFADARDRPAARARLRAIRTDETQEAA